MYRRVDRRFHESHADVFLDHANRSKIAFEMQRQWRRVSKLILSERKKKKTKDPAREKESERKRDEHERLERLAFKGEHHGTRLSGHVRPTIQLSQDIWTARRVSGFVFFGAFNDTLRGPTELHKRLADPHRRISFACKIDPMVEYSFHCESNVKPKTFNLRTNTSRIFQRLHASLPRLNCKSLIVVRTFEKN